MCSRLYMNLSMAYTPLYLQQTLFLEKVSEKIVLKQKKNRNNFFPPFFHPPIHMKTSIAFVPLLIYISGMIMSFFSNYIENRFGNKIHMCLGILLALFSSIWIILVHVKINHSLIGKSI